MREHTMAFLEGRKEMPMRARPMTNTVMLIEASVTLADMLSHALILAGYQVVVAAGDAENCCTKLRVGSPPAVVVVDLYEPGEDPIAQLRHLRACWSEAPPLIILTASHLVAEALASTERVIRKPFHLSDLLQAIQQAVTP
jgi:DNA-binding response OmpR family regulator